MLQAVKSFASSTFSKIKNVFNSIWRPIWQNIRIILIVTLIISLLLLILLLVYFSFKGVSALAQGTLINHTEQKIKDGTFTNQISFTGLGSSFNNIPATKFLIKFDSSQPINARVAQGTKLIINAYIQCQIITNNTKTFIDEYGVQNWRDYIKQKTKNVIIQQIALIKFYELNSKSLKSKINSIFLNYATIPNYPFRFDLLNLNIQYPENSFSRNNTLGRQLLEQKFALNQLQRQYYFLLNDLNLYKSQIISKTSMKGVISGTIKGKQAVLEGQRTQWINGLNVLQRSLGLGDNMNRYLWLYFQKLYNSTYTQNQ